MNLVRESMSPVKSGNQDGYLRDEIHYLKCSELRIKHIALAHIMQVGASTLTRNGNYKLTKLTVIRIIYLHIMFVCSVTFDRKKGHNAWYLNLKCIHNCLPSLSNVGYLTLGHCAL